MRAGDWKSLQGKAVSWLAVRLIMEREGLTVRDFETWLAHRNGPVVEEEDGKLEVGVKGNYVLEFLVSKKER